jgi:hypothetical protein
MTRRPSTLCQYGDQYAKVLEEEMTSKEKKRWRRDEDVEETETAAAEGELLSPTREESGVVCRTGSCCSCDEAAGESL